VARDDEGGIVARLTEGSLSHGDTANVIDVVAWSDTSLILRAAAPGVARAVGQLGNRVASATIRVRVGQDTGK
jgi:hypothetical protein